MALFFLLAFAIDRELSTTKDQLEAPIWDKNGPVGVWNVIG
jgi:hypothetical protein